MISVIDDLDLITHKLKSLQLKDNTKNNDQLYNYSNLPILSSIFQYLSLPDILEISKASRFWYFKAIELKFKSIKPFYYPPPTSEFKRARQTQASIEDWDSCLLEKCLTLIGKSSNFVNFIIIEKPSNIGVHSKLFSYFNNIQFLEFSEHLVNLENLILILSKLNSLKVMMFKNTGFHNVNYLTELEAKPELPDTLIGLEFVKASKLTEMSSELVEYLSSHRGLIKFSIPPYKKLLEPLEHTYSSLLHLNISSLKALNSDYLEFIMLQNPQLKSLILHSKQVSRHILDTLTNNLYNLKMFEILGDPLQNIPGLVEVSKCPNLTQFHLKVATTHSNVKQLIGLFPQLRELTLYDHIFPNSLDELVDYVPLLKLLNLVKYRLEGINFDKLHKFNQLFVVHCYLLAPWDWDKNLAKTEEKYLNWKFKKDPNHLTIYSKTKLK
ncbi:hypothetical protein CONCODRAFT_17612 [Conidiobolus coronatus NRRL 28638]|uniref:F-box domain-containing protein n=1 Tax=Conidiobolus coronatus (strain ATCC 28846 / CBS 209.66 / NRRL 28638) TaxID=796925 RepID=A0A137P6B3_CONC2|nr:hypothetical protein CONCODRAFT_17612 [Conidiobolus coronatus NRRL 28638]|eukprot:KXN70474.1 hypothetical protein CONCODRAFT_17612 [Conidiobolus coronatus NRRL 28638]